MFNSVYSIQFYVILCLYMIIYIYIPEMMRQLVHACWQNSGASLVPSLDSSRCSFFHWLTRGDAHPQPEHDDRWHMTEG